MPINKAMVFAAGLGTRMRPLTDVTPKPLIKIAGKPLIDYTLESLKGAGITKAIVNTHYKAEMVEEYLKNRTQPKISFSYEEKLLETGGGIVKVLDQFQNQPFFSANTDVILLNYDKSFQRMHEIWDERKMDMLLLLHPTEKALGYEGKGDFNLSPGGQLKKDAGVTAQPYIFTGFQIISPKIFAGDYPEGPFSLNYFYKKALGTDGLLTRIYGVIHDGKWLHIGTPDMIEKAEKVIKSR